MYHHYFGLDEPPFSIAVNPRYLFMSARHRDALAHLLYGVGTGGGFILLTGEVGTGKTTINRALLEQLPDNTDIAIILNPALNARELLASVCDELGIDYRHKNAKLKELTDCLHAFLLENHGRGRQTVLLIDEAQHLDFDVLEQIRLLTNLETDSEKLLQIILIGQPELAQMLARPELRQLNQRITARYNLEPLNLEETRAYIRHRLQVAGLPPDRELFPGRVVRGIYSRTRGIPRLINLLCDRILLGAYGRNRPRADLGMLDLAVQEVMGEAPRRRGAWLSAAAVLGLAVAAGSWWYAGQGWDLAPPALPGAANTAGVTPRGSAATALAEETGPGDAAAAVAVPDASPAEAPADMLGSLREVTPEAARSGADSSGPAGTAPASAVTAPAALGAATGAPAVAAGAGAQSGPATTAAGRAGSAAWQLDSQVALERLWSVYSESPLPPGLCDPERAPTTALTCVSELARGWAQVRAFDQPLLLDLVREDGGSAAALLLGIEGNVAMLLADGGRRPVPLPELAVRWSGEYRFLWRPPPGYGYPLALGANGPVVQEVAQMFARLDGQAQPLSERVFNRALDARVRLFQRRQGLAVDGVVGVRTLLKLNQALGIDPDNAAARQSLALAEQ